MTSYAIFPSRLIRCLQLRHLINKVPGKRIVELQLGHLPLLARIPMTGLRMILGIAIINKNGMNKDRTRSVPQINNPINIPIMGLLFKVAVFLPTKCASIAN